MNILEIAKECGFEGFAKTVICEQHQLQAFSNAVIESYKAGLVPVAYRTYDRQGWFNISPDLESAMRDFPTKEHTPLYALKETNK